MTFEYEPLDGIYAGDSVFHVYYHSPIQNMEKDEDFKIERNFSPSALQDGFGDYATYINQSYITIRIPEGARVGVEYAFSLEIQTPCDNFTAIVPSVIIWP